MPQFWQMSSSLFRNMSGQSGPTPIGSVPPQSPPVSDPSVTPPRPQISMTTPCPSATSTPIAANFARGNSRSTGAYPHTEMTPHAQQAAKSQDTQVTTRAQQAARSQATQATPRAQQAARRQSTKTTTRAQQAARSQATQATPRSQQVARSQTTQATPRTQQVARSQATQATPRTQQVAKSQATQATTRAQQVARSQATQATPRTQQVARSQTTQATPRTQQLAWSQATQATPSVLQTPSARPPHIGETPTTLTSPDPGTQLGSPSSSDNSHSSACNGSQKSRDRSPSAYNGSQKPKDRSPSVYHGSPPSANGSQSSAYDGSQSTTDSHPGDHYQDSDAETPASSINDTTGSSNQDSTQPTKNPDEFTIVVSNCEGVTGKKATIENMLTSLQPDVFLGVESKLDPDVGDAEFLPPSYRVCKPTRNDRKRGGGGVFIAVREGITAEPLKEFDTDCEIRWTKIHLISKALMIIGVFYKPPRATITSLHELNTSISKVKEKYPRANLFLGGDFNLPGIDWESCSHIPLKPKKAECEYLLQTAADFGLEQMNLSPTRKNSVLELLFTSCPETVLKCETGPGISDHDHIVIARTRLKAVQNKKNPRWIPLYKNANWSSIKKCIQEASTDFFKGNPKERSVDENWTYFKKCLRDAIDKFVPMKKISGRFRLPWITRPLQRMIRKKQRAYNRAKRSHKDRDWAVFRSIRKGLQRSMRDAHFDYINTQITEDGNKGLWRYLKGMRKDTCGVSTLCTDGKTGSEPREKAEMLNAQFSSVFTREDTTNIPDLGKSPYPQMPTIDVGEAGVRKLLSQVNAKKACGSDRIPPILLKTCADEIAPMLTFIIQQSLDTKTVPEDWRKAQVTPVFKKGPRSNPENYRPVSLTSICCKINEHIIVSQTMKHLEKHKILVDHQHGFRRGRSCETQLLITAHDLASTLNNHSQADVAVLDFAKAFDKVPHQRLIKKLEFYNLDKHAIGWITSFLSGRSQSVVVDGHSSGESPVLSGVPQGTVMGPLLFLLFINDISADVSSSIRLFADDCLIYRDIRSPRDAELLQQDLNKVVDWSKKWGMQFNVKKCNILSVTQKDIKNRVGYNYSMDGQPLETTDSTPYLGVTLNQKLHWDVHINKTVAAANRTLGFLRRTLYKCPQDLKETVYKTTVRPKLEYCSSIWDPHQQKYIKKIEMVQRRAARFVTDTPHRRTGPQPSVTAMVSDLGWETLQDRRQRGRIMLLYKVYNDLVQVPAHYQPALYHSDFQMVTRSHSAQSLEFQTLDAEVNAFKYAFLPRTIADWNSLPTEVVAAESLELLKTRLTAAAAARLQ